VKDLKVIVDKKEYKVKQGTTLLELSKIVYNEENNYLAAIISNEMRNLSQKIDRDIEVTFLDTKTKAGSRIHKKGLIYILEYAVKELYGKNNKIKVCHSIDKGTKIKTNFEINETIIDDIKIKMQEIVNKKMPFERCLLKRKNAQEYFRDIKDFTKADAFNYINNSYIYLYKLGDMYNYFYSVMPPHTGTLKEFDLLLLDNYNLLLQYPSFYQGIIPDYVDRPTITNAYNENYRSAKRLNISCSSDLNKAIANGKINDIIKLDEIVANNKLLTLAGLIHDKQEEIKIVLIAGPSSSGKTTTARKLSMFLKTYGLNPKALSTDDYFIPRAKTPILPNGEYDYENIKSINTNLFNEHLIKLLNHEEVEIPTYNFKKGEPEYLGNKIKLEKNDILIIEGLHGLNEELTKDIKREDKFKVYVSPLTDLNIDDHNMISTSDVRLLRRMIRDNRTRGYNVTDTIRVWETVRQGEEDYIFPYQSEADFAYNTALIYEIGVLKIFAEPLLYEVETNSPQYEEARRLIDFLSMFLAIPTDAIPSDSLLREFIGNGYFD